MTIMNSMETVINDHDEEWYWNNGDVLYVAQYQKSNNKCSFQISGGQRHLVPQNFNHFFGFSISQINSVWSLS